MGYQLKLLLQQGSKQHSELIRYVNLKVSQRRNRPSPVNFIDFSTSLTSTFHFLYFIIQLWMSMLSCLTFIPFMILFKLKATWPAGMCYLFIIEQTFCSFFCWLCFMMLTFESERLENIYTAWEDSQNWRSRLKVPLLKNKPLPL